MRALFPSLLLSMSFGAAQAPGGGASQAPPMAWSTEWWTVERGLPQNSVNAIVQDRSRMVWLGTYGGLVQFDGERMRTCNVATHPSLMTNRILALCVDRTGALWIGTESQGLVVYRDGKFVAVPSNRATGTSTQSIAEDADGAIWVGTTHGLGLVRGDRVELLQPEDPPSVAGVACAADGTVWAAADTGLWSHTSAGFRHWPADRLRSVALDSAGQVWCGGRAGLLRLAGDELVHCYPASGSRMVQDVDWSPDLGLLFTDGSTLFAVSTPADGGFGITKVTDCPGARCIKPMRNRHLLVGSDGRGLMQCWPSELVGLDRPRTTLVAPGADGGCFVVAGYQLASLGPGGREEFVLPLRDDAFAAAPSRDGGLWLGEGAALHRVGRDGSKTTVWRGSGAVDSAVTAICEMGDDEVLLGFAGGEVAKLRGGATEPLAAPAVGTVHDVVCAKGTLGIGGSRGVTWSTDRGRTWRTLRSGPELPSGEVRGLVVDDDGALWIATYGGGIARVVGGVVQRIGAREGLPCEAICQLQIGDGHLLVNTNAGLFSASLAELRTVAEGHAPAAAWKYFVPPPGVRAEANGYKSASSCRLSDGSWLFCNVDDVVRLRSAALDARTYDAPAVVLDSDCLGVERLAPSDRQIRVVYTAPSFDYAEFVVFRYRVGGEHAAWTLAGNRREALLSGLQPGQHRFEVQARGTSGAWGEPAILEFRVAPEWYETPVGWLLAGVFGLGGAFLIGAFASIGHKRRNRALQDAVAARTAELESEVELRRSAEVGLQVAQRELENRVDERTSELRSAVAQIEADAKAREALQRQVDQLQRMESVGKLAGGIAHDFNNLLTVVLGSSELLLSRETPDAETDRRDLLGAIVDASRRGRSLTHQLLTFARRQSVAGEVLDLGAIVRSGADLLRRLLPDNIRLEVDADSEGVFVFADRAQLEQVLLNLGVNARDAMPNGGSLRIELKMRRSDPPTCVLRVVDDGVGMTPEVRERACEPFFSTKHRATNSGLGLSTCYGIVESLGGALLIDSAPGRGTSITITLPCASHGAVAPASEAEAAVARRLSGAALLIEDHEAVREALARMLTSLGCDVTKAQHGDAAVAMLDGDLAVDFVVSDLIMPGLQGNDLVDALRARRPGLPIVFLSGYHDVGGAAPLFAVGIEVLPKPPDVQHLIRAIERARRPAGTRSQVAGG